MVKRSWHKWTNQCQNSSVHNIFRESLCFNFFLKDTPTGIQSATTLWPTQTLFYFLVMLFLHRWELNAPQKHRTWPNMAKYGEIWPNMAKYGEIWRNMAKYGRIWTFLDQFVYMQRIKLFWSHLALIGRQKWQGWNYFVNWPLPRVCTTVNFDRTECTYRVFGYYLISNLFYDPMSIV